MKTALYTASFNVRSYEVGGRQQATLTSIANYLQEIAGLHASRLNFDITHLNERGLTWVLFKMNIVIVQYPRRWQDIRIDTWPSSGNGIIAFRDYRIYNSEEELICKAISQWMVLDSKSKRPVRLPEELMRYPRVDMEPGLDYSRKDISGPDENKSRGDLVARVGQHHLDMNNHVNNARYIEWLTGYTGSSSEQPSKISVQFTREAFPGDEIYLSGTQEELHSSETDHRTLLNRLSNQHGELLAVARVHY